MGSDSFGEDGFRMYNGLSVCIMVREDEKVGVKNKVGSVLKESDCMTIILPCSRHNRMQDLVYTLGVEIS